MSIFIIRINSVSLGLLKHCRSIVDESHVNQQCNGGRCLASIFLSQLRSFVDFHLYFKSDSVNRQNVWHRYFFRNDNFYGWLWKYFWRIIYKSSGYFIPAIIRLFIDIRSMVNVVVHKLIQIIFFFFDMDR